MRLIVGLLALIFVAVAGCSGAASEDDAGAEMAVAQRMRGAPMQGSEIDAHGAASTDARPDALPDVSIVSPDASIVSPDATPRDASIVSPDATPRDAVPDTGTVPCPAGTRSGGYCSTAFAVCSATCANGVRSCRCVDRNWSCGDNTATGGCS